MSDYKHVAAVARGDHEAFKALFMLYFPKVKLFIVRLVKSDAVAEELAQDIFVKVWEKRQTLTAVASVNAYLYRMAKNAVLNYLQHKCVENRYVEQQTFSDNLSADALFHAKEAALLIQLTVAKMPAQRKRIFELSRTSHLKNEEIAQTLNLSKKTVENHINLALKEIREALKNFFTIF
jgi:RNA polymerase sigma-70 factor (ECF subfamily)